MAAEASPHPAAAAVDAVVRSAASEELLRAVGRQRAESLAGGASSAAAALAGPAALDAVYELFEQCVSLAGAVDSDFEDAANAAQSMDDIDWGGYFGIAVAETTANGIAAMALALDAEPSEDKAMALLERVGLNLDVFFAAHLFGELCRLEVQERRQNTQEERLLRALQAICAWALAAVGRVVGYYRFTGTVLWEWASGDAFWALVLAKGALSISGHGGAASSLAMPEELANLQASVLAAVLEFASPGVVLSMEQGADAVPITVWNAFLAQRRKELAQAMVCCKVPQLLISMVSRAGSSNALGLASFLVALLQPELALPDFGESCTGAIMLQEAKGAATVLGMELQRHGPLLWHLLADAPAAFGEYLPAQFVHDCADLAYFVHPTEDEVAKLIGNAGAAFGDLGILASACFLAANAVLAPSAAGSVGLVAAVSALTPEARVALAARFESWRGPVNMPSFEPWLALLEVPEAKNPVPAQDAPAPAVQNAAPAEMPEPARAGVLRDLVRDAPAEFRCAIDGQLMLDPVRSPYGHVFERAALVAVLAGNGNSCPVTGQPLALDACAREPELRRRITRWVRERGLAERGRPQVSRAAAAAGGARPAA